LANYLLLYHKDNYFLNKMAAEKMSEEDQIAMQYSLGLGMPLLFGRDELMDVIKLAKGEHISEDVEIVPYTKEKHNEFSIDADEINKKNLLNKLDLKTNELKLLKNTKKISDLKDLTNNINDIKNSINNIQKTINIKSNTIQYKVDDKFMTINQIKKMEKAAGKADDAIQATVSKAMAKGAQKVTIKTGGKVAGKITGVAGAAVIGGAFSATMQGAMTGKVDKDEVFMDAGAAVAGAATEEVMKMAAGPGGPVVAAAMMALDITNLVLDIVDPCGYNKELYQKDLDAMYESYFKSYKDMYKQYNFDYPLEIKPEFTGKENEEKLMLYFLQRLKECNFYIDTDDLQKIADGDYAAQRLRNIHTSTGIQLMASNAILRQGSQDIMVLGVYAVLVNRVRDAYRAKLQARLDLINAKLAQRKQKFWTQFAIESTIVIAVVVIISVGIKKIFFRSPV
jgi:hypothetical protein